MLSGNLLKSLRDLNRADKLYAVQVLVSDLAQEEANLLFANEEIVFALIAFMSNFTNGAVGTLQGE